MKPREFLKRIPPEIQCAGKDQFDTRKLAEDVAHRMSRKHGQADKHISTYKCAHCGKWHVGGSKALYKKGKKL